MEKAKIKNLIKSLIEVQERRQDSVDKMRLRNVRVVHNGQQYYAQINITLEAIVILPDNEEIPATYFLPVHLRECSDIRPNTIQLNQRFSRPPYILHFRTGPHTNRALRRIRVLIGAESTSESAEDL